MELGLRGACDLGRLDLVYTLRPRRASCTTQGGQTGEDGFEGWVLGANRAKRDTITPSDLRWTRLNLREGPGARTLRPSSLRVCSLQTPLRRCTLFNHTLPPRTRPSVRGAPLHTQQQRTGWEAEAVYLCTPSWPAAVPKEAEPGAVVCSLGPCRCCWLGCCWGRGRQQQQQHPLLLPKHPRWAQHKSAVQHSS